jgi:hypothetical protein
MNRYVYGRRLIDARHRYRRWIDPPSVAAAGRCPRLLAEADGSKLRQTGE